MNSHPVEVTLAVIPGSVDGERLLVAHRHDSRGSRIELRQQTWGEGIGWFTQNSVPLEPQQLAQLRATLGATETSSARRSAFAPSARPAPSHLRIAHAESA